MLTKLCAYKLKIFRLRNTLQSPAEKRLFDIICDGINIGDIVPASEDFLSIGSHSADPGREIELIRAKILQLLEKERLVCIQDFFGNVLIPAAADAIGHSARRPHKGKEFTIQVILLQKNGCLVVELMDSLQKLVTINQCKLQLRLIDPRQLCHRVLRDKIQRHG